MTILRHALYLSMALAVVGCTHSNTSSDAEAKTSATQADSLSLQSLFASKQFSSERLGSIRWMKDGMSYTSVEKSAEVEGARDIVLYQANNSDRKVLISAASLIPEGQEKPLTINDYKWNSDQSQLLVYTNSKKVWRSNSRGDYWLFDIKSGKLSQLGINGQDDVQPSSMMFAKFSPDDKSLAFVRDNNLFVESLSTHTIKQLTTDGNGALINGIFDWVYEEEFGIADGFKWSPDSSSIAYWQLNTSAVRDFTMINNTDELYPTLTVFPYPKAGEKNSTVKVGIVSVGNAQTKWADLPTDTDDFYIPRMNWAGNSEDILIQKVNRLQNQNDHFLFNAKTSKVENVLIDKDGAFFEWYYDVKWLDKGETFLKISERDGWRHVYRVTRDGSSIIDLTPGEFDIVQLVHVDEASGHIYFTSGKDNVIETNLFRAQLDGKGDIERLTPENFQGSNGYQISPDGKLALHYHSAFRTPTQYRIVNLPDHSEVRTLVDNSKLAATVEKQNLGDMEFFRVPSFDGTELDGYIIRPPNFNPKHKYPIIFYVYGEPWGQTVKNAWGGTRQLWSEYLAQQGFIVASIDNRGTKSPRGSDWRKQIYRNIGTLTAKDQAAALDAMLARWSYIDGDRVGIWGHSGGGSQTLNMLFRFPEKYHVGIASAPVPDIRLYDTIYQERYMGLPDTHTMPSGLDAYDQASPITFAENLQGKLLLIHGTGDDNVHYQGSERLIDELVKHNKQFEFMSYPNRSHSLREGEGTTLHRMTLMTEFFKKNLVEPADL